MAEFKRPGVYIREISTLPASVVPIATAIPAFIGYTAKREKNGEPIPNNKPTRITSYLEFKEIFGDSFYERYEVSLTSTEPGYTITDPSHFSNYLLPYHVYLYFLNGGGPCYIVSVGTHISNPSGNEIDPAALLAGLAALEEEDEPTLLVVPEAAVLSDVNRTTLHDQLLAQCAKLQDRFAIMDVLHITNNTPLEDATAFRNQVGTSDLKYGAAYYPGLKTFLFRNFNEKTLILTDNRGGTAQGPFHQMPLEMLGTGSGRAVGIIQITNNANLDGDSFTIDSDTFTEGPDFTKEPGPSANAGSAENLLVAIQAAANPNYTARRSGATIIIEATAEGSAGESLALTYTDNGDGGATISPGGTLRIPQAEKSLYNAIKAKLESKVMTLYPSAAMAGVYARVDGQRGVWKAPANVSLRGVSQPSVLLSSPDQEPLNVDATSGKSINAIRLFPGKGNLVWGARTLAGNDNEWRYIPVRRLYIFVEESVKKATEFVVFEPNDANTWMRVKAMIENFLSGLWREGALAGAKPEQAFFVRVGLGQTMTSLDILEGRMNVEIGLAAVRPAEFIILKFSHKLQES
ncbi:MAG: bacteriophage tail sheath protein [Algoriphagus marincola HL-49]|uniref:Bacteriophage tail sheath protein n=1 Tax=Algoriphagus marincola HL-49 TaxID=1305737 RepID=A0A0P7X4R1_9BACT|nr:MAG: bacteriophage tail sheath protein [Algoriphagus marincola HL-49]